MNDTQKENLGKGVKISEELAREYQLRSARKRATNRMEKRLIKEVINERLKEGDLDEIIDNLITRAKASDNSFTVLQSSMGQAPTNESKVEVSGVSLEKFLRDNEG